MHLKTRKVYNEHTCFTENKFMQKQSVKILLSLDYEIFFGKNCGSVEHCIIKPTEFLLAILDKYNYKMSLFVDAGFLLQLKQQAIKYPQLKIQYQQIKQQLLRLSSQGHDIQLHIHPHWQDSYYNGESWEINTERYRLHDFTQEEINAIVQSYKQELESCSKQPIFAFRAGGWCLQPFDKIKQALQDNDIWLDSTVFSDGHSDDPTRWFDFKHMPQQGYWHFDNNPLIPKEDGYFTEVPISATKTSPLFFWKLALRKKFASHLFAPFSDGQSMRASRSYYIERLTKTTYGPVMIDGLKAGQLEKAYQEHLKQADEKAVFNAMGHPKTLSPYSLIKLEKFIKAHPELMSITYQDLKYSKSTPK